MFESQPKQTADDSQQLAWDRLIECTSQTGFSIYSTAHALLLTYPSSVVIRLTAGLRTLKSYSSSRDKSSETLDSDLINISVNCAPVVIR